jgi:hypothetical protein
MKDLVVLAADRNIEYAVKGLLGRPKALGICPVEWDVFVHPRRDSGCRREAHDFLRAQARGYRYALVMFDHHGSGREQEPPDRLAASVEARLASNGWKDRAAAIVLTPELEVWVWTRSPHVDHCLGWADRQPPLREWLEMQGHWPTEAPKPPDPKAALEAALREVRRPRSSAVYLCLANTVELWGHTEPAFVRFAHTLQRWFPI